MIFENNFAERLIEDEPAVEFSRLTMEQLSPVFVLDAFYVEDTPSPGKYKLYAFNGTNQVDIYSFVSQL